MCPRLLTVGICLLILVGCKRGSKDTGASRDDAANARQPALASNPPERKTEKEDQPNWLKDDRAHPTGENPTNSGKQPWNVGSPAGTAQPVVTGTNPTSPSAQPQNPMAGAPGKPLAVPGGMGVPQPNPAANVPAISPSGNTPLGAAKRAVAMADMRDLQIFIDTASLASGKMPTGAEIFTALVEARSPAAALVKEGAVILTGTKERESVWAFEARAYLNGGLIVTQNGVETVTAGELKKRLGK